MTIYDGKVLDHPLYAQNYNTLLQEGYDPETAATYAYNRTQESLKTHKSTPWIIGIGLAVALVGGIAFAAWTTTLPHPESPKKVPAPIAVITPKETLPPTITLTPTPSPTTAPSPSATPSPTPSPTKEAVVTPPKPVPVVYATLTARQWQLIAKHPDAYAGDHYVVYGVVTQFDSATGTSGFRANVDGVRHTDDFDYTTNTILAGDETILESVVQDDMFVARITVEGAFEYETQIGGKTIAPQLQIDSITVYGG